MVEYIMEHVRCSYEYAARVDRRRTVASFLTNHSIEKNLCCSKKLEKRKRQTASLLQSVELFSFSGSSDLLKKTFMFCLLIRSNSEVKAAFKYAVVP